VLAAAETASAAVMIELQRGDVVGGGAVPWLGYARDGQLGVDPVHGVLQRG
jgi:hypothetical protein